MHIPPALATAIAHHRSLLNPACTPKNSHNCPTTQECTDDQFVFMLNAYRGSGGLARDKELLSSSRRCCGFDAGTLVSWITERQVIGFFWQSRTWLPLFQFNLLDMTRAPALGQVLAELTPVYDAWELANWFSQPNPWLADCVPAEALESDPCAVLQAARVCRFIANA